MKIKLLVNQVGYEIDGPKRLLVQSDEKIDLEKFYIAIPYSEEPICEGKLECLGEIKEWGLHYWEGVFTDFKKAGRFIAFVEHKGRRLTSPPFQIGHKVLKRTIDTAARFFYYQRCGTEVPGLHGPCHTDDGFLEDGRWINAVGGWHDAGDYNKYNGYTPLAAYALAYAFEKLSRDELNRKTPPSKLKWKHILDEALWGVKFLLKTQTSNGWLYGRVWSGYGYWGPPELENNPRIVMGKADVNAGGFSIAVFAKLSRLLRSFRRDVAILLEKRALLAWRWYSKEAEKVVANPKYNLSNAYRLAPMILATVELKELGHAETLKLADSIVARTIDAAKIYGGRWFDNSLPSPPVLIVDMGLLPAALLLYSKASEAGLADEAKNMASDYIYNYLCKLTENPLGIPRFYIDYKGKRSIVWFLPCDYFGDWHVGPNSYYLSIAWTFLLASRILGDKDLAVRAVKIIDWILGANPFTICMLEGEGTYNLPEYHHRYGGIPGNKRGAVPGAIPNGICREPVEIDGKKGEGVDKPFIDLQFRGTGKARYETNEPWLPHNAYYLLALSEL